MVALFVLLTFGVFIGINAYLIRKKERTTSVESETVADRAVFSRDSILLPQGFYFSKGHTWAKVQTNGDVKLGIDDFLNKVITSIKITNATQEGVTVKRGDVLFNLEISGKSLNVLSPIDGKVGSVNHNFISNQSASQYNPYTSGWLFTIEPENLKENLNMMMLNSGKEVIRWMSDELTRLKDFISVSMNEPKLVGATMYDGGNFIEGVVNYLPETKIEQFEKDFLKI